MLEKLKEDVLAANLELPRLGLVDFTWGNVSAKDPESGFLVIKPSGVAYDKMRVSDMVVVDEDGNTIEGTLKPSSDLATHLVLYQHFSHIGAVVHTHSNFATVWAQACCDIPAFGTTHADYFSGSVPCTDVLSKAVVEKDYEKETGIAITQCFDAKKIDSQHMSAVLVANHGPFTWGKNAQDAVHNAAVLEIVARMAWQTKQLSPSQPAMPEHLLEKHFSRKHGPGAYYGQTAQKHAGIIRGSSCKSKIRH